jgi:two-component system, NarL family, sensor histidine kinase DesK
MALSVPDSAHLIEWHRLKHLLHNRQQMILKKKRAQEVNNKPAQERTNKGLRVESPYLVWLIWIIWLPFAIPDIINIFHTSISWLTLVVILICLMTFLIIYLQGSWRRAQRLTAASPFTEDRAAWTSLILLIVLSCILVLVDGKGWLTMFYFVSGYVGGGFSTKRIFQILSGIMLIILAIGLLNHENQLVIVQTALPILAVSFIALIITSAIRNSVELRTAREEVARLATMTERLRIARDLHDLLGHNLSLIALKSELAGRLVRVSPERAIVEIGDVEQVARTTLQEVREAVASYRQPTLANELHGAQEILTAAGIAYHYENTGNSKEPLPSTIEAVLAWTVREGVTNIIKHSRAQECTISIRRNKQEIQLEILDDGAVPLSIKQNTDTLAASSSTNQGNGLRGLTERVEALNGKFDADFRSDVGFCLAVSLPLTQKTENPIDNPNPKLMPIALAFLKHSGDDKERNKQL